MVKLAACVNAMMLTSQSKLLPNVVAASCFHIFIHVLPWFRFRKSLIWCSTKTPVNANALPSLFMYLIYYPLQFTEVCTATRCAAASKASKAAFFMRCSNSLMLNMPMPGWSLECQVEKVAQDGWIGINRLIMFRYCFDTNSKQHHIRRHDS